MESRVKIVLRVIVIAITALGCAWALREWCYEPYACNVAISEITARTAASDNLRGEYAKVQRAEANIARLRALEPHCRTDVRLYMLLGGNEALAGQPQNAVRNYELALTIDRRPEIYIALAEQLILLGRIDEAVDNYVIAGRFSPAVLEIIPSEEIARRVRERLQHRG
jgi:tetratricopeptide (TPR) repeat protein